MSVQKDSRGFKGSVIYNSAGNELKREMEGQREVIIGRDPQRADIVLDDPFLAGVQCSVRLDEDSGLYAVRNLASSPVLLENELEQKNGWSIIPPGSRVAMGRNQEHLFLMGPVIRSSDVRQCDVSPASCKDPSKKKFPLFVKAGILVLIALLLASIGYFAFNNQPSNKISKYMDLGQKYLSEMKYDEALLAFEKVIALDPKKIEAYEGMADAYAGKQDYEKAAQTLEDGLGAAVSDELSQEQVRKLTTWYQVLSEKALEEDDEEKAQQYHSRILSLASRTGDTEKNAEIVDEVQTTDTETEGKSFPFGTTRPVSMTYTPDGDSMLYSVTFEYDADGKLLYGHYVNPRRGRNGTYRYNYDGNKLISRDFKWNDKGDYGQTVTYTYGQSGYVESGLEHEEDEEEGMTWHEEIRYEYGNDGKLLRGVIEGYEDDGEEVLPTNGVYEFAY